MLFDLSHKQEINHLMSTDEEVNSNSLPTDETRDAVFVVLLVAKQHKPFHKNMNRCQLSSFNETENSVWKIIRSLDIFSLELQNSNRLVFLGCV